MYLYGSFINKKGDTVTVYIVTDGSKTVEVEIGDGTSGVWFTDDPVSISSEVNDCFDHLLRQSATVRLLTDSFMGVDYFDYYRIFKTFSYEDVEKRFEEHFDNKYSAMSVVSPV